MIWIFFQAAEQILPRNWVEFSNASSGTDINLNSQKLNLKVTFYFPIPQNISVTTKSTVLDWCFDDAGWRRLIFFRLILSQYSTRVGRLQVQELSESCDLDSSLEFKCINIRWESLPNFNFKVRRKLKASRAKLLNESWQLVHFFFNLSVTFKKAKKSNSRFIIPFCFAIHDPWTWFWINTYRLF